LEPAKLFSVKGLSIVVTVFLFVVAVGLSEHLKKDEALPKKPASESKNSTALSSNPERIGTGIREGDTPPRVEHQVARFADDSQEFRK